MSQNLSTASKDPRRKVLNDLSTFLKITLYKPSGDEDLRQLASSLREEGASCVGPDDPSGKPSQVEVTIEESLPDAQTPTEDDDFAARLEKSNTSKLVRIISSSNLEFEKLDVRSEKGWLGIRCLELTSRNLTLYNAWIGNDSPVLEKLVSLELDCNTSMLNNGPLTGEWLLTMLSKTKNLEVCILRLERAHVVGSNADCPSEVKLEKIERFDVSLHKVQTQTIFSKLTLPETANVKISTTVTNLRDAKTLARVAIPPEWTTSKQRRLKFDVSKEMVTDRIGDNHLTNAQSWVLSVINDHGNAEGRLVEAEISFPDEVEGFYPLWWVDFFVSSPGLESLVFSGGEVQNLCEALGRQLELDGGGCNKVPRLQRLELRKVDFAPDGTVSAVTQALKKRKERGCPIKVFSIPNGALREENLSQIRPCVEVLELRV